MVLHNICLDYGLFLASYGSSLGKANSSREPSQLKAISDGACPVLLEIIGRKGFLEDEELDYFGRVLELLLSHGKNPPMPSRNYHSLT